MIIFVGYLLEFIIIFLWYIWVLKGELKAKHIVRRSVRNIFVQRTNIVRYLMRRGNINEEQKKAFDNIRKSLVTLLMETYMFLAYVILGPIIIKQIISNQESKIIGVGFYIVILCALILKRLKEDTQRIVMITNTYIEEVMIPVERRPELLQIDSCEMLTMKWNRKKVFIVLICIIIVPVCFVVLKRIENNKVVQIIAFGFVIFTLIKDSKFIRREDLPVISESINLYGDILESVKTEIVDMCEQLGIKSLECKISNDNGIWVESTINERNIPEIEISYGFIREIYHSDARDILLYTIAHELAHIYYNDFTNIRKRMRKANGVCALLDILTVLGLIVSVRTLAIWGSILVLFVIETVLEKVMCDIRYWEQIAELRADRLAVRVCKADKMAFVIFWREYFERETKEIQKVHINIVSQFYRKYIRVEGHPSM